MHPAGDLKFKNSTVSEQVADTEERPDENADGRYVSPLEGRDPEAGTNQILESKYTQEIDDSE